MEQNWEDIISSRYVKYYQIGGLTIRLSSDLPFLENTYAEKFKQFEIVPSHIPDNSPHIIHYILSHSGNFPEIKGNLIYQRAPWQIFFDNKFYYYQRLSQEKKDGREKIRKEPLIAKFSKDYKKGVIYKGGKYRRMFLEGNAYSLLGFPTDQIIFSQFLAQRGGIILHSSGVIINGRGYIFCGPSGAGKSTILKLLLKALISSRTPNDQLSLTILNDDRIIIRINSDFHLFSTTCHLSATNQCPSITMFGTPWHGGLSYVSNLSAKIEKIFILNKCDSNFIEEIPPREKFYQLYQRVVRGFIDERFQYCRVSIVEKLVQSIPIYRLDFSKANSEELLKIIIQ